MAEGRGEAAGQRRREGSALRLHAVAIRLLRSVRAADAASGMSAARLSVLSVLVFGGPRTVGELAAAEQVSAPTMTRLVAALEREGFVRREADARDGRIVRVRALARARAVLAEGRARRVALLVEKLAPLDEAGWRRIDAAVAVLEPLLTRPLTGPGTQIPRATRGAMQAKPRGARKQRAEHGDGAGSGPG